jgi:HEPN domain-containing protein
MTPEQFLLDETQEWVKRAEHDLHAADLLASELPAQALFHCQQAAEKFLKAFLTFKQLPFRKTHELKELGRTCAEVDRALGPILEPAYALTEYAWKFRYPGAPYDADAADAARGRHWLNLFAIRSCKGFRRFRDEDGTPFTSVNRKLRLANL